MSEEPETVSLSAAQAGALAARVVERLESEVLGQERAVEVLLAAYMGGGHVLIEGLPGLGKTLLARSFAACLGADFARVQFTPDLMPADVIGTNVFEAASGGFRLMAGPVFTRVLMADEINRTPPKTQAALLEAMQERQVTIDGVRHPLADDFFVVATQNPIELEGVYPLPEAQLDRFLARVVMGPPRREAELEIYGRWVAGELPGSGGALPDPVLAPEEIPALRRASRSVHVEPEVLVYLADLAAAVRASEHVELAVSPRGALALLEAGRGAALLAGRDFVTPDDLKRLVRPCWAHRVVLTAEAELEGRSTAATLEAVAEGVEVPR